MTTVTISLSGLPVTLRLRCDEAATYFTYWPKADAPGVVTVSVPDELIDQEIRRLPEGGHEGHAELSALVYRISNALLSKQRCFYHGTVIRRMGKAWIFTGPSGIGKSTQYLRWKELIGDELRLLCGDRPVIGVDESTGRPWVHPSPWNGKESYPVVVKAAPLGGIICLDQSDENTIRRLTPREAIAYLYPQFMFLPDSAEAIHRVASILETMITNAPVWLLSNRGDLESARLGRDTIDAFIMGESQNAD